MKKGISLFWVNLIFPLFLGISHNVSAQVLEQDSLALVTLYNSTNGANWTNNTNWLTGPVSTWYGISASSKRVDVVNLERNNLVGTIPPEIGNLTNLIFLYLIGNQLEGTIPSTIGNLINLTHLSLETNQLSGTIPSEIGNLTNLTDFHLDDNQLSGTIPDDIGNLTNLKSLDLANNQLLGAIPTQITNLTKLNILYLHLNEFVDLPDLSAITTLERLWIQSNKFTFEDIEPNIGVLEFLYSPQDSVGEKQDTTVAKDSSLVLSVFVAGTANQYLWMKNGIDIAGADSSSYVIDSIAESDTGSYICRITNTIANELTLYSRPINVSVEIGVGVDDHSTKLPETITLYQNYPNPFNPTTSIRFNLPVSGFVTLKIYNLLGREVETLVNDYRLVGEYEVKWNAKDLPTGLYFYRLEIDNISETKKSLLQK